MININERYTQTLENLDINAFFSSRTIMCNSHPNSPAMTLCLDCKTFCCLTGNCGQPHIYHSIENLEHLINGHIAPTLNFLIDYNKEYKLNHSKHLHNIHTFKNNLKNFAVEEKRKIDEEYRKILTSLHERYNNYMDDINLFIENMNAKFESVQAQVESTYKNKNEAANIEEIFTYVNSNLNASHWNFENFITRIGPNIKKLCREVKTINENISKFDYDKIINDIKTYAEKDYGKIQKNGAAYFCNLNSQLEQDLKQTTNRASISKLKRQTSKRKSAVGSVGVEADDPNLDIDLDLFVRNLHGIINKIRANPIELLSYVDEYIQFISPSGFESGILNESSRDLNDTSILNASRSLSDLTHKKINYIYEYINFLKNKPLAPLEWDNDLSNSAEDYLKSTNNKIERDPTSYKIHMKEIAATYFDNEDYLKMFSSLSYVGSPQMMRILVGIMLNENYWTDLGNANCHLIFDPRFNLIGICGGFSSISPTSNYSRLNLILNLSYFKK